ncbi:hypothetical protein AYM93_10360 [Coxiella burnetii]|nr:hypothetical protein [Coxiella burnetii]ABX78995.1 hypothetical protein COXBURSA331_A0110 [Coxiella burnetii RSA 331]AIT64197.1 putative cytosolic protein [Coxiella burnetii str. Namibia]EDR36152.1 hypothetical protein COXBURSA334_0097 [Coxiella burnetii Q321]ATN75243.1 hypothetical protein AYM90_09865 [Coxiella burnetii]ATN77151.1 hypothetical protein AYM94_09875 [Coxiella burnetii]
MENQLDDYFEADIFNYCAVVMLETLGNEDPTQSEIDPKDQLPKILF